MRGGDTRTRVLLDIQPDGNPYLELATGTGRAMLSVIPDGATGLRLVEHASGRHAILSAQALVFRDGNGQVLWQAP